MKYFIAILPPEPISTEIYQLKEYFRDHYNSKASLNSPAHITLHMPFDFDKEDKLVAAFRKITIQPFTIELKDFNSFPPRVIFVNVAEEQSLNECHNKVNDLCKRELAIFNADYKDQPFHPHITIAFRDLKKNLFHKAWEEFKTKTYAARFECNHISLLKHDGKFWREFS